MEAGDEGIERVVDSKDLQQQSKALDKLTDHVEDRQLDSTRVQEVLHHSNLSFTSLLSLYHDSLIVIIIFYMYVISLLFNCRLWPQFLHPKKLIFKP